MGARACALAGVCVRSCVRAYVRAYVRACVRRTSSGVPRWPQESITKPRLSTGSEFCIFNRFPRGHYLVWWVRVRVRVSLGVRVRVRVRVSNLLGSR